MDARFDFYPIGVPLLLPRVWQPDSLNFDSFGSGFFTLFTILNRGGLDQVVMAYIVMAYTGMASTGMAYVVMAFVARPSSHCSSS